MVLLDGGLGQPGDPDAVAAHPEGFFLAGLCGEGGLEGLGILAAQLKDVAHFDAAGGFQPLTWVVEAAVPGLGGPQVRVLGQRAEIGPGGAQPMAVRLVGPADEPLQLQGGGVRQPQELMFKPWRNNRFGAGCEATTRCRGWVIGWVNSLISQVGAQVAEGDVVEAHAQLPAIDEGAIEGSHLQ